MGEKHGVGRAEFGDLVEAAVDEIAGCGGVAFFWEIWGLAIYNCLEKWLEKWLEKYTVWEG